MFVDKVHSATVFSLQHNIMYRCPHVRTND